MIRSTCITTMFLLFLTSTTFGQLEVELSSAFEEKQLRPVNRNLTKFDPYPGAVALDAARGDGMAVLNEIIFDGGTIRVELLGENNPGRSFIGIAFNIRDSASFEAVYFRPFNFVASEPINRAHMVQYICHPEYTWNRLREEWTGEFENEIPLPPDPDRWFKATITVHDKFVEVFVGDGAEPVLKVERLAPATGGKIGLWVGNGSSGRFRNLVLDE